MTTDTDVDRDVVEAILDCAPGDEIDISGLIDELRANKISLTDITHRIEHEILTRAEAYTFTRSTT